MNHRRNLIALGANTLIFALLMAGCGDYGGEGDDDDTAATGGAGAGDATGGVGAGGAATGGEGAGTATGGAGPVEASCDNAQACGGEVVGTWNLVDACVALSGQLDLGSLGVGCTFGTVTGSSLSVTGSMTFGSDASLEDNLAWTGQLMFDLAPECLSVSGTFTSCDRLAGSSLPSVGYAEGLIYSGVVCTPIDPNAPADQPSGCNCTATIDQPAGTASGGYMVENNVITTSNGGEDSYCVDGTTLVFTPTKFSTDTSTTTTGTLLFQKQ